MFMRSLSLTFTIRTILKCSLAYLYPYYGLKWSFSSAGCHIFKFLANLNFCLKGLVYGIKLLKMYFKYYFFTRIQLVVWINGKKVQQKSLLKISGGHFENPDPLNPDFQNMMYLNEFYIFKPVRIALTMPTRQVSLYH